MKVKLKSLVRTVKSEPMAVSEKSPKAREIVPEVTLNTAMKGMSGLSDCKVGKKYRFIFDAEVTGDRSPRDYEVKNEGFKTTDRIVDFKLVAGALEPKTISEAAERMKSSGEKY